MAYLEHLSRLLQVSMLAAALAGPTKAHEITPAIADVEVSQESVTLSIRMALEPLLAGINLAEVTDSNETPEAALYDQFRAFPPDQLEAVFRGAWPRLSQGLQAMAGETPLALEIVDIAVPAVGDIESVRSSILTLRAALPDDDSPVTIGWQASYGALVLRQVGAGEDAYEDFLNAGNVSDPLPRTDPDDGGLWGAIGRTLRGE